jgi:asparagine synthase (glutamine-hydrolysing)
MANSVEGRFPFLDHRIVEFAARLPANLKMNTLQEKYLLKRVAARFVPSVIIDRPKQPYRAPDARIFLTAPAGEYIAECLSPEQIQRDGVFNPAAVSRLMNKARNGSVVSVGDNMAVVGIVSSQLLIHRFINHHFSAN